MLVDYTFCALFFLGKNVFLFKVEWKIRSSSVDAQYKVYGSVYYGKTPTSLSKIVPLFIKKKIKKILLFYLITGIVIILDRQENYILEGNQGPVLSSDWKKSYGIYWMIWSNLLRMSRLNTSSLISSSIDHL